MSTFSFGLPAPPSSPPPPGGAILGSPTTDLATLGMFDLAIDPATRDLIDAADGGPLEVADARTAVMFQLACRANRWWRDPLVGSRNKDILSGDAPADIQMLVDEAKRCLQILVEDGTIRDLKVISDTDEGGRAVVVIYYRDGSTGTPIDLVYNPMT